MSILVGPIWSRCGIALTCRARSHFQRTQSKEIWGQGWNERYRSSRAEGEYEKTKTGKRKAGEKRKRKQATDFEEVLPCVLPYCGRSEGSIAKT